MVAFPLSLAPTYDDGQGIVPLIPGNPFGYEANRISEVVADKVDANQVWVPDLGTVDAREVGIYANNILAISCKVNGAVDMPVGPLTVPSVTIGGNIAADSANITGNLTVGGQGLFAKGSESALGVVIGTGVGFYQTFNNQLDFAAADVGRARLRDTAFRLLSTVALEWGSLNTPSFGMVHGGARQLNIGSIAGSQLVRVLGSADEVGSPTNWGGLELSHTGTAGQVATANGGLGTAGPLMLVPGAGTHVAIYEQIRFNNLAYSKIGTDAASQGPYMGYNFTQNGNYQHAVNGTLSGIRTHSDGIYFYVEPTADAGTAVSQRMQFTLTGLDVAANVTVGGQGLFANSTAAAPAVAFTGATNSGLGRKIDGTLILAYAGVERTAIDASVFQFPSDLLLSWTAGAATAGTEFSLARGGARQLNIGSTLGSQVVRVLGSADDVGSPTNWNGLLLTHDGTRGRITVEAGGIPNQGDLWLEARGNRVAVNTNTGAPGTIEAPLHVHHTGQGVDVSTGLIIERPNGNSAVEIRGADTTIQYLRFGGQSQKGAVAPGQIQYYAASHAATPNRMLFLNNLAVFMDVDGNQRIALPGVLAQTTDPGVAGRLWTDTGDVRISGGAQPLDLEDTDAGVYDLGTGTGVQPAVQLTGLTLTVPADAPSSDDLIVSIRVHVVNATTHTGAVEIGIGVNLAEPTTWIAHYIPGSFTGVINETFVANDFALTPGASLNVWARLTSGSHPQYNVSADGTTVTHTLIVQSN